MLGELDSVDWQTVTDAFGPAVRVPGLLRALASPDVDVRTSAREDLTNRIWHQTSLYDATALAIPFLVELLNYDEVEDKHHLLGMLWGIAGAGAPGVYPPYSDQAVHASPPDATAGRVHQAAREGIPAYLPFLKSTQVTLRVAAVGLLSLFPEDVKPLAPMLRKAIEKEHDPAAKAEMVESLGYLLAAGKEHLAEKCARYISFLFGLLNAAEAPEVQFAAAKALPPLAGPETPPSVVDLLLKAISAPNSYSRLFTSLAVSAEAAKALAYLQRERGAGALIPGLGVATGYQTAHEIIEHLLDLAFRGKQDRGQSRMYRTGRDGTPEIHYSPRSTFRRSSGEISIAIPEPVPITPVTKLSSLERQSLSAIVESDVAWSYRTNLYGLYGLPSNREELHLLLSKPSSLE